MAGRSAFSAPLQRQKPRAKAIGAAAEAGEALVAVSARRAAVGAADPLRGLARPQRQVRRPTRPFGAFDRRRTDADRRCFGGAGDRRRLVDPCLQLGDRRRQRSRGEPPLVGAVALTRLDARNLRTPEAEPAAESLFGFR
jgi:hypothetical protein